MDHNVYVRLIGLTIGIYFFPGCHLRQCALKQTIPRLNYILLESWANNATHTQSLMEYWLYSPLITMPEVRYPTNVSKFYME